MARKQQEIHDWFHRLLALSHGDMHETWHLINREIECEDNDREALRAAFHNFNSQFLPE